jgi:very-short-patch-repair endonuclease
MRQGAKTKQARRLRSTMTRAEVVLWSRLRRNTLGCQFRRQHPIGPYIADFACAELELVIEVDGDSHAQPGAQTYDNSRTRFMEAQGWTVERFWNPEIVTNIDGVVERISDLVWTLKNHRSNM